MLWHAQTLKARRPRGKQRDDGISVKKLRDVIMSKVYEIRDREDESADDEEEDEESADDEGGDAARAPTSAIEQQLGIVWGPVIEIAQRWGNDHL